MKAMVLGRAAPVEAKPLTREDRQEAAPAPDEVSIAIEACAIR
jgi:D-arabinose 1-dehydrogenase-like Zn-dependent alcohol dehydrogenase